jgi:hypothetical protein
MSVTGCENRKLISVAETALHSRKTGATARVLIPNTSCKAVSVFALEHAQSNTPITIFKYKRFIKASVYIKALSCKLLGIYENLAKVWLQRKSGGWRRAAK